MFSFAIGLTMGLTLGAIFKVINTNINQGLNNWIGHDSEFDASQSNQVHLDDMSKLGGDFHKIGNLIGLSSGSIGDHNEYDWFKMDYDLINQFPQSLNLFQDVATEIVERSQEDITPHQKISGTGKSKYSIGDIDEPEITEKDIEQMKGDILLNMAKKQKDLFWNPNLVSNSQKATRPAILNKISNSQLPKRPTILNRQKQPKVLQSVISDTKNEQVNDENKQNFTQVILEGRYAFSKTLYQLNQFKDDNEISLMDMMKILKSTVKTFIKGFKDHLSNIDLKAIGKHVLKQVGIATVVLGATLIFPPFGIAAGILLAAYSLVTSLESMKDSLIGCYHAENNAEGYSICSSKAIGFGMAMVQIATGVRRFNKQQKKKKIE